MAPRRIAGGSAGASADRRGHLSRIREPSNRALGEHRLAVDEHLEDAAGTSQEARSRPELLLELRCQTGSPGLVVSHHAVLDGDIHLPPRHAGPAHARALPMVAQPPAQYPAPNARCGGSVHRAERSVDRRRRSAEVPHRDGLGG